MNFTSDLATGVVAIPVTIETFLLVCFFLLVAFQCKVLSDLGLTVRQMKHLFDD
jgi:hypothetical protein